MTIINAFQFLRLLYFDFIFTLKGEIHGFIKTDLFHNTFTNLISILITLYSINDLNRKAAINEKPVRNILLI